MRSEENVYTAKNVTVRDVSKTAFDGFQFETSFNYLSNSENLLLVFQHSSLHNTMHLLCYSIEMKYLN